MDRKTENQLMAQHCDMVRQRLDSENLSILELRLRGDETRKRIQDDGLSTDAREMARAEFNLINAMIHRDMPPAETPREMVDRLRSEGRAEAAEGSHPIGCRG